MRVPSPWLKFFFEIVSSWVLWNCLFWMLVPSRWQKTLLKISHAGHNPYGNKIATAPPSDMANRTRWLHGGKKANPVTSVYTRPKIRRRVTRRIHAKSFFIYAFLLQTIFTTTRSLRGQKIQYQSPRWQIFHFIVSLRGGQYSIVRKLYSFILALYEALYFTPRENYDGQTVISHLSLCYLDNENVKR